MAGKVWWFFTILTYAAWVCCGNQRPDKAGQQRLWPVVLEQLVRQQVCSSPGPQGSRERTGCPLGNLFFPSHPLLESGGSSKTHYTPGWTLYLEMPYPVPQLLFRTPPVAQWYWYHSLYWIGSGGHGSRGTLSPWNLAEPLPQIPI